MQFLLLENVQYAVLSVCVIEFGSAAVNGPPLCPVMFCLLHVKGNLLCEIVCTTCSRSLCQCVYVSVCVCVRVVFTINDCVRSSCGSALWANCSSIHFL